RATDAGFNRADWATATAKRTLVDGAPPTSTVNVITPVDAATVQVSWRGSDFGSGVATYDVWVRQGTAGDWTRWQRATTALSAEFTGQTGQTYYFRSQAIDRAGLREPWRPSPQAQTTLGAPDAPAGPATPTGTVRVLLPLVTAVAGSANAQDMLSIADWPTLGGNAGHTGVNAGDPGASRYARVWSTELGANGEEMPQQVTSANGLVLALVDASWRSGSHPRVVALDVETGIPAWGFESALSALTHPPAIAHGAVYFGQDTYTYDLLAVDLRTGHQIWAGVGFCEADNYRFQHPLVVGNRIFLGIARGLDAIAAASGQSAWHFSDHCYTNGSDGWAAAYYGGRLYYQPGGYLVELDANTGQTLRATNLYGDYWRGTIAAPVVTADTIVSVAYDLTVLERGTHQLAWTIQGQTEDYYAGGTMPAVAGRVVYALRANTLRAYNLSNGVELWRFTADGPLLAAPIVAGQYVYVASATHTYVLNRQTHLVEWDTPTGGILSIANGYLFIAETIYDTMDYPQKAILHAYRAQEP
ncbi:MAG TPA: PQQ-binding-like beta-propeller repeat protein, partial [Promineifilum sp.]|nr:PQQ-binding-like beta-propeller repeat protein [Promineifilum sp.]